VVAERVSGPDDPRVAMYRAVSDPELARAHGVFIAEGRLVVRRVLEDSTFRVHSVLLNDAAHRDLAALVERLDASIPLLVCDTSAFTEITGYNIHRGCLALVERPAPASLDDVIGSARTLLVLDGVANPDNVGGLFRNAAAFDAAVLLNPAAGDPLYRKAVRTSMAAVLRVPFARSVDWPADLERVRGAGFTLITLTPREPAEPIDRFAARTRGLRFALIVGAEGSGVTSSVDSMADLRVRIPIADAIDSLNVAVAAGVALYCLGVRPDGA